MKALIHKMQVAQIVADGEEFPVAPPLYWTEADNTITTGHTWNGEGFDLPPQPTLAEIKRAKGAEFIAEGVIRIAAQVSDWDSIESIKTAAGMWPAIGGGATAAMMLAKDIYLYLRDTVPAKLAALASQAELDAIDPGQADPFGDGTGWPA